MKTTDFQLWMVMNMMNLSLDGQWTLTVLDDREQVVLGPTAAKVPGTVYSSLLDAGLISDPFWRDNELAALKLMEHHFEYQREFTVEAGLLACDGVLLRCDGLDTLAEIRLNGRLAGTANNMHRIWEYDVRDLLRAGTNQITVSLASPTRFIRAAWDKSPIEATTDAMLGFPHLRKAHCMFGWDWGPRLPDAGIWRSIGVQGIEQARLDSVYIRQHHTEGAVDLDFEICNELWCDEAAEDELHTRTVVIDPAGRIFRPSEEGAPVRITDPQLWWPNGYGRQPLYTARVELLAGARLVDAWERRIGLRTMRVRREKDEWGESFAHEINGVAIFAMGADYIPEDNLLGRLSAERTRRLLADAAAAHFNCIRVWGGGYYPEDWFYDACDELGLVVWQDFMCACANYELTPEFDRNIRAEFADNIRRLRHHAALGLWCGNNEMEMFQAMEAYHPTPKQKADYIRMFEYILPEVLAGNDPETFYWPASPSSGGSFDAPNDPNRGDVHYWDVWHGNKPFSEYRKFFFRYASEFGFQSFPSLKTVESFTEPQDRNVFARVMEMHQRNASANGKIMNYLSATFLYPKDFDHLLYASQLLQAEAIRYGVEHWRRNRGRCMGAIYWQLIDCWPVASWSSIDYFGRWKALHYAAKRFFAPVLLSCCEEGEMTLRTSVVEEPRAIELSARLVVANETRAPISGLVRWALRDPQARVIRSGEQTVTVPALTSVWLDRLTFPEAVATRNYLSYELQIGAEVISSGTVLFCAPKHFEFAAPKLSWELSGDMIIVRAGAYARAVEIECPDSDLKLSDNYFDLNGDERAVRILSGTPDILRLRSVYDIAN